jgi:predicted N-acyltransferase
MMKAVFLDSITDIDSSSWQQVVGNDYPFLRHDFLAAMELSGSACSDTGWQAQHLLVYQQQRLVAVMPLYLKDHSYGEYIFDWNWANAYQRYGLPYYPKLLSAIPFTPATGARLSYLDTIDPEPLYRFVAAALKSHAEQLQASSIHILLPIEQETRLWKQQGLSTRTTSQYHWFNHQYQHFDDFLDTFNSRKRKNLNKERRRIGEQGISLQRYSGQQISAEMWDVFYHFYQTTYAKRSGHGGYLRRQFFDLIHHSMLDQIMLVLAKHGDRYVAGALYFFSSSTLYGRYWGCSDEFEMLHFEACYYQGIEFCIERGLSKFDAGAQGEHKIQRGFEPTAIWSNHWIKDPQFAAAIQNYIDQEADSNQQYMDEAKNYLPFKKTD